MDIARADSTHRPYCFHGIHILAEFYGVSPHLLNDVTWLKSSLQDGIQKSKATLCQMVAQVFEPQGLTIVCLLAESHVSLHAYPEHGAMFCDAFTCNARCHPRPIVDTLIENLKPERVVVREIERGGAGPDIHRLGSDQLFSLPKVVTNELSPDFPR